MNIKNSYKKIIFIVVLFLAFCGFFALGIWYGTSVIAYHVPQPGTIDFSLFWDAYNKLQQNFIDPSKITNEKIIYGAIAGMTKSLDDPYTEFFDPAQAKQFNQDLTGSFDGIGAEIGIKKQLLTIIAPLKNSPAQKAGLRSGDIIIKIDGKDATNMTSDQAVTLIRGKKGTPVILTVMRDSWTNTKDFKIVRDTIVVPSMDWSLKDGDVAYIQIYQFDNTLPDAFQTAALQILQSPAKRIVLDLRGDPGGYLESAQYVAGWFLQKDKVVDIQDFGKSKPQKIDKVNGNAQLENYPIVILIDQGSASASEILSGALRDNRNIKLIGNKSFGKGCVQDVINLRDGSFIKITVANWLTPKGSSITNVGLTPDVKVDLTEQDVQNKKDPQLDKALEIVKSYPIK